MALSEHVVDDKIEIVGDYKHIQIRTATIISRDGVEVSRSLHRRVISPLDDVSNESLEVQNIAAVVHTNEIKEAYRKFLESQESYA